MKGKNVRVVCIKRIPPDLERCQKCPVWEKCGGEGGSTRQIKKWLKELRREKQTKQLPEELLRVIFNLLMEVQPKHIDEIGFFDENKKLLVDVFPALQVVHLWYTFDGNKEVLAKSSFFIKRAHQLLEIRSVKVYSEEVSLESEIEVEGGWKCLWKF